MFQGLISLRFCSTFSSQNLWLFCRRDLSLSEPFLEWFLMVWAPIWLPKPSRRPSRRHPKKKLNFDTYFLLIFGCFGDPLEHPKSQKMVLTHRVVVPFWLQKRSGKKMRLQDAILEHFGFQNWSFGKDFRVFFVSCWALEQATASGISYPTMHFPNKYVSQSCTCQTCVSIMHCQICVPIMYLPNMHPNRALAKYASQTCTCQICIPNVHWSNMRPKHALAKYASQTCTCQIHSSTSGMPGTWQELVRNLPEQ